MQVRSDDSCQGAPEGFAPAVFDRHGTQDPARGRKSRRRRYGADFSHGQNLTMLDVLLTALALIGHVGAARALRAAKLRPLTASTSYMDAPAFN